MRFCHPAVGLGLIRQALRILLVKLEQLLLDKLEAFVRALLLDLLIFYLLLALSNLHGRKIICQC